MLEKIALTGKFAWMQHLPAAKRQLILETFEKFFAFTSSRLPLIRWRHLALEHDGIDRFQSHRVRGIEIRNQRRHPNIAFGLAPLMAANAVRLQKRAKPRVWA
jgi:hypothetical protein